MLPGWLVPALRVTLVACIGLAAYALWRGLRRE